MEKYRQGPLVSIIDKLLIYLVKNNSYRIHRREKTTVGRNTIPMCLYKHFPL